MATAPVADPEPRCLTTEMAPRAPMAAGALKGSAAPPTRAHRQGAVPRRGAVSLLISALIVLSLVTEAWTFITQVEWASLWSIGWFPRGVYTT